ncbi:MAG: HlyD family efflux transporter periplasmic adaptor subunit [Marinilabiliales bacterium]
MFSCSNDKNSADAYGNFETDEIIVSSEVNGKIIKFTAEEGDIIDSGEVIAIIDTTRYILDKEVLLKQKQLVSTKFKQIMAQIDVYKKQKENLLFDKKRVEKLVNDGAAPQKQLDDIINQIKVIDEQINAIKTQNNTTIKEVESIDAQTQKLNDLISRCKIKNPVNGTILEKYLEENELAVTGKPVYKVAGMDELYLRAYITGNQLSSIKTGDTVKVYIDNENDDLIEYDGIVTWISSQAEFTPKIIQTREERVKLVYAIKVKVKNDGKLKIGMPGEIKFN